MTTMVLFVLFFAYALYRFMCNSAIQRIIHDIDAPQELWRPIFQALRPLFMLHGLVFVSMLFPLVLKQISGSPFYGAPTAKFEDGGLALQIMFDFIFCAVVGIPCAVMTILLCRPISLIFRKKVSERYPDGAYVVEKVIEMWVPH